MNVLFFNNNFPESSFLDKDVLSAFKPHSEKSLNIREGMTVKEISDVVSDRVIAVVKEQFQATKERFQAKTTK